VLNHYKKLKETARALRMPLLSNEKDRKKEQALAMDSAAGVPSRSVTRSNWCATFFPGNNGFPVSISAIYILCSRYQKHGYTASAFSSTKTMRTTYMY